MGTEKGDHAFIFTSILYSFAVGELFRCWTRILQPAMITDVWSPPSILTLAISVLLVQVWWGSFDAKDQIGSGFPRFSLAIAETLLFFALASKLRFVLSPEQKDVTDVMTRFSSERKLIYVFGILLCCILMLGNVRPRRLRANGARLLGIGLLSVGIMSPKPWAQWAAAGGIAVSVIAYTLAFELGWLGNATPGRPRVAAITNAESAGGPDGRPR